MNLAEFGVMYRRFAFRGDLPADAGAVWVRDLFWPEWVDLARRALGVPGRGPRGEGGSG